MKRNIFILKLLSFLFIVLVYSCNPQDKDGQLPITADQYLVSYNQAKLPLTQPMVKGIFENIEKGGVLPVKFSDKVKYGVWIYKVSYKTKFKSKDVVASGVVCVPMTEAPAVFPMISFHNGTNTLHSQAPSVNLENEWFSLIQMVASMGYVVVIPDYLGFGTSSDMFHPYLDKSSTVSSILDMYGAVKEMTSEKYLDINLGKDLFLMGYSQGAWVSMALHEEIESKHASEYNLKGTAAGGGPYNLTSLVDNVMKSDTYPMPVYLGYLFNSFIQTGIVSISYPDVFNAPFAGKIIELYNGQRDGDYINGQLSNKLTELFTNDFRENYASGTKYATFRAALETNSIKPWKTNVPLMIRHGATDTYVPTQQSIGFHEGLLAKNVDSKLINYAIYPLFDHNQAVLPFGMEALNWILAIK
jgi:pimeloyl-ACP methyl ester carboxylesterase